MRIALLNTGTELLLGDVRDAHLVFIAHEIFPLGLRIAEQRTVPDDMAIRDALADLFTRTEILFVTGGLGPTTDDITRDVVANVLGLELRQDPQLLSSLRKRLKARGIKWTPSIGRQAEVPAGAQILANENGSASGLYLKPNINPQVPSPHLIVLPGPLRELQPMFRASVMPILLSITQVPPSIKRRLYKIAGMGESIVEEAIGEKVLAIPGVELGYCARPGEVDVRIIGDHVVVADLVPGVAAVGLGLKRLRGGELVDVVAVGGQPEPVDAPDHGRLHRRLHRRIAGKSHYKCAGRLGSFCCWLRLLRQSSQDRYVGRRSEINREARRCERESRVRAGQTGARACKVDICACDNRDCWTGRRFAGKTSWNGLHGACRARQDRGEEILLPDRSQDV